MGSMLSLVIGVLSKAHWMSENRFTIGITVPNIGKYVWNTLKVSQKRTLLKRKTVSKKEKEKAGWRSRSCSARRERGASARVSHTMA